MTNSHHISEHSCVYCKWVLIVLWIPFFFTIFDPVFVVIGRSKNKPGKMYNTEPRIRRPARHGWRRLFYDWHRSISPCSVVGSILKFGFVIKTVRQGLSPSPINKSTPTPVSSPYNVIVHPHFLWSWHWRHGKHAIRSRRAAWRLPVAGPNIIWFAPVDPIGPR